MVMHNRSKDAPAHQASPWIRPAAGLLAGALWLGAGASLATEPAADAEPAEAQLAIPQLTEPQPAAPLQPTPLQPTMQLPETEQATTEQATTEQADASNDAAPHDAIVQVASEEPAAEASPSSDSALTLDSVLVAVRQEEGERAPSEGEDVLEPISQFSEYEPELAEPQPAAAPRDVSKRVSVSDLNGSLEDDSTTVSPASFHGVTPGVTSRVELVDAWGKAASTQAVGEGSAEVLHYPVASDSRVDVLVEDRVVRLLRITLAEPEPTAALAKRLRIESVESVDIRDATGELLGVAYPEKGVMLLIAEGDAEASGADEDPAATHIVLQELDAEAFALRAELRPADEPTKALADLEQALALDPKNAHAQWLMAGWETRIGKSDRAEAHAAAAVRLDPENASYRIRWADTLLGVGQYDQAVLEARKVIDDQDAPDAARAQALHTLGRLASLGDQEIESKAIGFHNAAIALADSVATLPEGADRRAAKELLVGAHLAVAKQIARGEYARQAEVVAEWIGRASGLAEEAIVSGDCDLGLRMQVAIGALDTLAEMKPTKDPGPWIKEADETAQAMLEGCDDELERANTSWLHGVAHAHALRVEHTRREPDAALAYGAKAIELLSGGAEPRAESSEAQLQVGQLYFYIGAVNAIHKQDHAEAVAWFDKARSMMDIDRPQSELFVPRREGETLVSMAVSYWDQDQREVAIELTETGAEQMERAHTAGVLEEKSLSVPYGNLATMHRRLGNRETAAKFSKMARLSRPDSEPNDEVAQAPAAAPASPPARNGQTASRQSGSKTAAATQPSLQPMNSLARRTQDQRSQAQGSNPQSGSDASTSSRPIRRRSPVTGRMLVR
ncbi:Tetratricopeptide repeat protein [Pseudobythopirellula maris]|uniref:Tetratricopeptide repeat protein n=1 Tax=Pseudobythopirellula maris TaxID=2527991 RepID=A0A5C5ZQU4_9BACT|nr:hypothetical protein [Pseudobythopirellula maris]TWT88673.1 Tetratricopeptide repeat protein [Pseudobythopirellula maris]